MNKMIDYLIDLNKKTNIPLLDLVKISEEIKYFTKDKKIIQQYMTNNYGSVVYDKAYLEMKK